MKSLFQNDSIFIGILVGIVLFGITYALIQLILVPIFGHTYWLSKAAVPALLSLVPNIVCMRLFLINLKKDKIGRGLILISFVLMLLSFILFSS